MAHIRPFASPSQLEIILRVNEGAKEKILKKKEQGLSVRPK